MKEKLIYGFPFQLLALHLRKNLFLVALWGLLALIVLQQFGTVLGIPFLFLDPEYLNEVSWRSYCIVGVALAVFTMAFHMTTYILDGAKFTFLAVVPRPFIHFCLNNFIIPLLFYCLYCYLFIVFQLDNEHENKWIILEYFFGFVAGSLTTFSLLFAYFRWTNKDFFLLFAGTVEKQLRKTMIPRANMLTRIKESKKVRNKVDYYLGLDLRPKQVRKDLSSFQGKQLLRVFDQNHLNMFIIIVVLVSLILLLGVFREYPIVQIPAAASGILLLAILTMFVGAVSFWLRDWATPVVIGSLLLFNLISKTELLNRPHAAFGINYSGELADYRLENLQKILHPDTVAKDRAVTIEILENWRAKFPANQKPKMVFIAVSGGGQRAALWTLKVLQEAEYASGNQLFKHTQMISGASGGVVGAAFFRELYLRAQDDPSLDIFNNIYLEQIASDNLNPIIFTLLVNDMLIRTQNYEYKGRKYLKDRGHAFENQLNINTKGVLDKPLRDYLEPEWESRIPMMPITPMVTNDGRKLYISPFPVSYMSISEQMREGLLEKSQGIDFQRFFEAQDPGNLRFISALRMGATFPFVTPNVHLPSTPRMETMDSGLSDNFGIQDAMRFVFVFRNWIEENTSGVLLVSIRDSEKFSDIEQKAPPGFLQKLFTPLKNIYINWDNVQTLKNETLFTQMKESMPFEMERIEFEYATLDYMRERGLTDAEGMVINQQQQEILRASLNWRLAAKEKKSIIDNINTLLNQQSLRRLKRYPFLEQE